MSQNKGSSAGRNLFNALQKSKTTRKRTVIGDSRPSKEEIDESQYTDSDSEREEHKQERGDKWNGEIRPVTIQVTFKGNLVPSKRQNLHLNKQGTSFFSKKRNINNDYFEIDNHPLGRKSTSVFTKRKEDDDLTKVLGLFNR